MLGLILNLVQFEFLVVLDFKSLLEDFIVVFLSLEVIVGNLMHRWLSEVIEFIVFLKIVLHTDDRLLIFLLKILSYLSFIHLYQVGK